MSEMLLSIKDSSSVNLKEIYDKKKDYIYYYISDLHLEHRLHHAFPDGIDLPKATEYIKSLCNQIISATKGIDNCYLLIAGDTTGNFELAEMFYKELRRRWRYKYSVSHIIVVLGNHELMDPPLEMDAVIEKYRELFQELDITFLHNALAYGSEPTIIQEEDLLNINAEKLQKRPGPIILGGIGFSGLDPKYNASTLKYGLSFNSLPAEAAIQKDIEESKRFEALYQKALTILPKNRVIVLSHTPKSNWTKLPYQPGWIYINGHDHRNYIDTKDAYRVYADNQIGYQKYDIKDINLKWFIDSNQSDPFLYLDDGIHRIDKPAYQQFLAWRSITMRSQRDIEPIYMLKKSNTYMFITHCYYDKNSKQKKWYLLNGGALVDLHMETDKELEYFYDYLDLYAQNVNIIMADYSKAQYEIAKLVKRIGGDGTVHGCIIDIDEFNHLYLNPLDGTVTAYYADDITSRKIYKSIELLLESMGRRTLLTRYRREIKKESSLIKYNTSFLEEQFGEDNSFEDIGTYPYKVSGIIKTLQYCIEDGVVRKWYDEILKIDSEKQITENTFGLLMPLSED